MDNLRKERYEPIEVTATPGSNHPSEIKLVTSGKTKGKLCLPTSSGNFASGIIPWKSVLPDLRK